jgi:hypothetical protein
MHVNELFTENTYKNSASKAEMKSTILLYCFPEIMQGNLYGWIRDLLDF